MPNKLLTIEALAAMLNVSPRTVQREIDAGAISTVRVRRLVRSVRKRHETAQIYLALAQKQHSTPSFSCGGSKRNTERKYLKNPLTLYESLL